MKYTLLLIGFLFTTPILSQIGINNTSPNATLEISASSVGTPTNEDGILIPRVDEFPVTNPTAAQDGMLVFITGNGTPTKGFYYWDNGTTAWVTVSGVDTQNSLDEAYDEGGPGMGRIITADNGAVEIQGTGGVRVEGDISAAANIVHDGDTNTFITFTPDRVRIDAGGRNYMDIQHTGTEVTFNEDSTQSDFRVESGTQQYMLFVDGSNDAVGIGRNNPVSPIHIDIETPFDLDYGNIGQDDIFLTGGGIDAIGEVGASIGFGGTSNRNNQRRAAIASIQTGGDRDHTGLSFYVHGNAINQSPMEEGMRLSHQGYLGINNTSPDATLDVVGTMQFVDGNESNGFVLTSDATGNASWADPSSFNSTAGNDIDITGTQIDIEPTLDFVDTVNSPSDDFLLTLPSFLDPSKVQMTGGGQQFFTISPNIASNIGIGNSNGADNTNPGFYNIFLGYNAGEVTTSTTGLANEGSRNIAIGQQSLFQNTTGVDNIAIGNTSMRNNIVGNENIALGAYALRSVIGSGNVGVGNSAGFNETGSNKLYIENSQADADNALVYGDFGTDATTTGNILRTNSEFQIGNPTGTGYAFPTADGTANQVLETDGSGQLSWVTPSTSITASNGLTATAGDVALGGALTSNTNITQGLYDLNFSLTDPAGNFTVDTDALVVESTGDVGFGIATPAYDVDVLGSEPVSYVVNVRNASTNVQGDGIAIRLGSGISSVSRFIDFYRTGGAVNSGSVQGNGGGVNYATTSDRRLKMNIYNLENALDKIDAFQPRVYEYKAFPGVKEMGFIAQELKKVYPQAVSGDESGDVKTNPMMVDYSRLTPILTAGVKELHERVKALEEENEKLKAENNRYKALEARIRALENK